MINAIYHVVVEATPLVAVFFNGNKLRTHLVVAVSFGLVMLDPCYCLVFVKDEQRAVEFAVVDIDESTFAVG